MMKRLFSALLLLFIIISLAACSHAQESSGGAVGESGSTRSEDITTEYNSESTDDKPSGSAQATEESPGSSTRAAEEGSGSSSQSTEESSSEISPASADPSVDTAASADTTAAAEPAVGTGEAYWVSGVSVNFRKAPGTEGEVISRLSKGTEITVFRTEGDWLYIRVGETMGYIYKDYASDCPPSEWDKDAVRIVVKKSERKLELWQGGTLIGTYRIGLGHNPVGHKQAEGDGRTPEGEYYICMKNSRSSYYLSLGISYPNTQDAAAALKEGRISQAVYDRIASANEWGERPDWYTPRRRDHDPRRGQ